MHRLKIYLPARIAGSRLHGASTIGKLVLLGEFMDLPAPCGSSPAAPTRTLILTMSCSGHGTWKSNRAASKTHESQSKTSLHRAPYLYVRCKCSLPAIATGGAQNLPSSKCTSQPIYMAQSAKCRLPFESNKGHHRRNGQKLSGNIYLGRSAEYRMLEVGEIMDASRSSYIEARNGPVPG